MYKVSSKARVLAAAIAIIISTGLVLIPETTILPHLRHVFGQCVDMPDIPLLIENFIALSEENVTRGGNRVTEATLSGNGTLKGIDTTSQGKTLIIPRPGAVAHLEGKASFLANDGSNGRATYTFQAIEDHGAAFFDDNATGSLTSLNNMVGVYKVESSAGGYNTFTMWEWGG